MEDVNNLFKWDSVFSDIINQVPNLPAYHTIPTNNGLAIEIPVPGMTRDAISVTHENNLLTITGENKQKEKQYHTSAFKRQFQVPASSYDVENIGAILENGVLRVELRYRANPQPEKRKIFIK